jgi:uncharacterized protein (DUF2062 family)
MIRRVVQLRIRRAIRRCRRFIHHNVLHADDPPDRLALGAAVAMFITFTPTIGIQMLLVVFAAWLLRANKVIGLPIVWISNPATMVPIYYSCYLVGRVLLGQEGIGAHWWRELQHPPAGWWPAVQFYWIRFLDIATPLWIGSMLIGFVLAYITYYVVFYGVTAHRSRLRKEHRATTAVTFHADRERSTGYRGP